MNLPLLLGLVVVLVCIVFLIGMCKAAGSADMCIQGIEPREGDDVLFDPVEGMLAEAELKVSEEIEDKIYRLNHENESLRQENGQLQRSLQSTSVQLAEVKELLTSLIAIEKDMEEDLKKTVNDG